MAWQLRAIVEDDIILMTAPASGKYTKDTIIGAHLAIPLDFFYDDLSAAPKVWGYIGTVIRGARADRPACWVQFHDGEIQFYLNPHPNFLDHEMHRYLNSPKVRIVSAPTE